MSSWFIRRANIVASQGETHGWVDLGIVATYGGIIKLQDGSILESVNREYYVGTLDAGTYKFSCYSINSNYPGLATSANGTSYSRKLSGTNISYTDEEVVLDSATYIRMNGCTAPNYPIKIMKWYD